MVAGIAAHLAEPAETAAARGRKRRAKTDRSDSRLLRELLDTGRVPECWIRLDGGGRCLGVLLLEDLRPLPGADSTASTTSLTERSALEAVTKELGARLATLLEDSGGVACDTWESYRRGLAVGNAPPRLPAM